MASVKPIKFYIFLAFELSRYLNVSLVQLRLVPFIQKYFYKQISDIRHSFNESHLLAVAMLFTCYTSQRRFMTYTQVNTVSQHEGTDQKKIPMKVLIG